MKPTRDESIEAKEVYIQLSLGRYKGKLALRNLSPSIYIFYLTDTHIFAFFIHEMIYTRIDCTLL